MKQKELGMSKIKKTDEAEQKENNEVEGQPQQDQPVDSELQNIIEAALFASREPLGVRKIMSLFPEDAKPSKVDIQNVILSLEEGCEFRGIELRRIGKGWRFQTKEKYSSWLRKLDAQKPPRYSRALLETMAIIAYRQPVTRGDIEEIRGVGVSSDTIRTLEERGWIEQVGHRDVPGRPSLFGTTQGFLEYFNMSTLRELPELMDKRDLGEIAKDMNLTLPMDGVRSEAETDAANQQATADDESNAGSTNVIDLHPKNGEVEKVMEDEVNETEHIVDQVTENPSEDGDTSADEDVSEDASKDE